MAPTTTDTNYTETQDVTHENHTDPHDMHPSPEELGAVLKLEEVVYRRRQRQHAKGRRRSENLRHLTHTQAHGHTRIQPRMASLYVRVCVYHWAAVGDEEVLEAPVFAITISTSSSSSRRHKPLPRLL